MAFQVPRSTLQVLLAHILDKPRAWVMAHPEAVLTDEQAQALEMARARVEGGEPLPYVLGRWEFFGLDFVVTPDVLIPRPETELLVEQALEWWRNSKSEIRNALLCRNPKSEIRNALLCRNPKSEIRNVLDVGTGSGCIAIALAVHVPELHITATDISSAALVVARANAQKHGVADRIQFLQADLFNVTRSMLHVPRSEPNVQRGTACPEPVEGFNVERFDLVVANLPYIPTGTLRTLEVYGKEPSLALDGGPDGLAFIQRLLQDAPGHLTPGGQVLLEIEASQGEAVRTLGRTIFPDAEVDILPDLAGLDRLLRIHLKAAH